MNPFVLPVVLLRFPKCTKVNVIPKPIEIPKSCHGCPLVLVVRAMQPRKRSGFLAGGARDSLSDAQRLLAIELGRQRGVTVSSIHALPAAATVGGHSSATTPAPGPSVHGPSSGSSGSAAAATGDSNPSSSSSPGGGTTAVTTGVVRRAVCPLPAMFGGVVLIRLWAHLLNVVSPNWPIPLYRIASLHPVVGVVRFC